MICLPFFLSLLPSCCCCCFSLSAAVHKNLCEKDWSRPPYQLHYLRTYTTLYTNCNTERNHHHHLACLACREIPEMPFFFFFLFLRDAWEWYGTRDATEKGMWITEHGLVRPRIRNHGKVVQTCDDRWSHALKMVKEWRCTTGEQAIASRVFAESDRKALL